MSTEPTPVRPALAVQLSALQTEHVRVVDRRRPDSAHDMVLVELGLGDALVIVTGTLNGLQLVVAEVARQLVVIEDARRGPEGMAP